MRLLARTRSLQRLGREEFGLNSSIGVKQRLINCKKRHCKFGVFVPNRNEARSSLTR